MMGATYFTPLIGGAVADRFGRWLCIAIAAFLLASSYGLLTVGFLPLSIILLSVGMGLFKGNITAAVASLYQTETERDLALNRLYWAVNLGALPAGFVGGWLASHATATPPHSYLPQELVCSRVVCGCSQEALCSASIHTLRVNRSQAPEKDRLATIYVLLPVAALFFLSFHQNGSSLTLFAKDHTVLSSVRNTNRSAVVSERSCGLILTLSPLLALLWRRWPLASHHKFMLGMFLASASSLIMSAASIVGGNTGRVSPWWLLSSYFVISVGELCVAPIGFSLVTKLAPKRLLGVLMGAWFAAIALGNLGAGLIGRYWSVWPHHWFFFALATTSGFAALLLMLQQSRLRRVLGGS
jgi:POT family proton-dependent oligopeptide transporter